MSFLFAPAAGAATFPPSADGESPRRGYGVTPVWRRKQKNGAPFADTEGPNDENAAVKVKSGAALAIGGTGTLTVDGNAKNGIKGAADAVITVAEVKLNINAADDGLSCDDELNITGGTLFGAGMEPGAGTQTYIAVGETSPSGGMGGGPHGQGGGQGMTPPGDANGSNGNPPTPPTDAYLTLIQS